MTKHVENRESYYPSKKYKDNYDKVFGDKEQKDEDDGDGVGSVRGPGVAPDSSTNS